ncbi:MAG: PEP-CTERM sorting domain-containing protein [Phycisphaerae bacterium]
MRSKSLVVLSIVAVLGLVSAAMAVPYASGVVQNGASSTFVLNEDGANVKIVYDGGATVVNMGTLNKGTHTFDATLGSSYQIKVSKSAAVGWTQISTDQTSTSFYFPVGVSVNRNPGTSNFGSVYVSNATTGTTAYGRNNPEGIYRLKADMTEINWGTAGVVWGGASGPWKSAIGTDDRVYVTDLSNDLVFDVAPDLSSAVQLIDASNRTAKQWVGAVVVEGTQAAGNRKIYLANVNYNDTARKGLIQYTLGANPTVAPGDTGVQYIGPSYYTFYPYDYVRDSNGDWYDVQFRYYPTQAPAISKFLDSAVLPINTAVWTTPLTAPYNGGYCLDIYEEWGWVAYGNYYDGWVHIFNMADGSYVGGFDAGSRMRDIAFDAAGNIYTVDNLTEWLRVWSPGGDWMAITGSDGSFVLIPEPAAIILLALGGLACMRRRRTA